MSANERLGLQQPEPVTQTIFYLLARHGGAAIVPIDDVVRDYFSHLSVDKFSRKVLAGAIDLAIVRTDSSSQKSARGVFITDLAAFIDKQRAAAIRERDALRPAA